MTFSDIFLDPPVNAVANVSDTPLLIGLAVFAAISVAFGIVYTRRTGSPLYFWSALAGWTLYPLLVEPFADWFVAVWYPNNLHIAATVFDRPMPWFAVLFYGAGIPLVSVVAYEIAKRGLPAKRMLQLVVVVAVLELPGEIIGGQLNTMIYYGNHSVILGVPIYCYVQNAGMFAVVAWVLAWLLPHIRGWRWIVVPFAVAATLPVYALVATFPAYIAILTEAGPVVGWLAGILATILNAAVVVACIYSPQLQRLRQTTDRQPDTRAPAAARVAGVIR